MNCVSCRADNEPSARFCFACGAPLDSSLAGLAEGALFAARYEILGPLGRGGMGMVYKAFDRELGETVAIKVLRPDVARESGRSEQRFRSEIRLARRVRHRNVCSVYGDGEDRGLLYICMEVVEGENLARPAREGGGLPPDEAWSAVLQVADGLSAIHEVGVVHRDLKTANLMRDRNGVVHVMDFGIAKQHGAAGGGDTVTATGTLMGTPEYMSPEQLRGEEVGFRSDLYSLGIVAYELFSGALPFRGDTPVATIVRQLQAAPYLDLPALPESLRPVLARALAKDPADRYATAAEMRAALEGAFRAAVPGATAVPSLALASPNDETRPIRPGLRPEGTPLVRIAVAQAALAVLAVHLVSAGGVDHAAFPARPAVVVPTPAPTPTPSPVPRAPVVTVQARPVSRPPAPRATPVPTPLPLGVVTLPDVEAPPAPLSATWDLDTSRVYEEDEVDIRPRRLAGTTAPYPDWGPRLPKGRRVSITASYVVTEDGHVTDIRVERGGGVLEAVLLEISRWKFEPGMIHGVPVKVRLQWKHTFIGG
jgi:outer membrane biosynthesis protein TonB/predicted Ser/Thr protein kinase